MVFFAEFELCDPRRTRLAPMSGRTRRYSERSPSLDGVHEYQHWTGRCATPPLSLSGLSISPTHGSASDGRPLRATRRPSFSDGGAFTPRAVASACMTPPNAGDERRAPSDGALGATMPSPIERKHDIAKRRRRVQCHGDAGASGSPRRSPSKAAALRRACEPDEGEPCSAQQPHHHLVAVERVGGAADKVGEDEAGRRQLRDEASEHRRLAAAATAHHHQRPRTVQQTLHVHNCVHLRLVKAGADSTELATPRADAAVVSPVVRPNGR